MKLGNTDDLILSQVSSDRGELAGITDLVGFISLCKVTNDDTVVLLVESLFCFVCAFAA